jgi:hypothetical protein
MRERIYVKKMGERWAVIDRVTGTILNAQPTREYAMRVKAIWKALSRLGSVCGRY